jgi:hypothetical protein
MNYSPLASLRELSRRQTYKSLFFLVSILLAGTSISFGQSLTDEDRRQIKIKAERQVGLLESLLNLITNPTVANTTKENIRKGSFDKTSSQRTFSSPRVRIYDDWDPQGKVSSPVPLSVSSYLKRAGTVYEPANTENVKFSSLRVIEIDKRTYVYARVVFISQFYGSYIPNPGLEYPQVVRVAEVIAEKLNGSWQTTIGSVSYASREEIELAYGSEENIQLINRMEVVREQLIRDARFIEAKINDVLREINKLQPGDLEKVEIDEAVQKEAARLSRQADSLAKLAQNDAESINQYQANMKVQMVSMDSLIRKANGQSERVNQEVVKVKSGLDSLKKVNGQAEEALSRTEAGASYVINLARKVKVQNDTAKLVLKNYEQASSAAKGVERSAEETKLSSDEAKLTLSKLKQAERRAADAEMSSARLHQEIEQSYGRAVADQQRANNADTKASIYIQTADSLVKRIDSLIGGNLGKSGEVDILRATIQTLRSQGKFEMGDRVNRGLIESQGLLEAARASGKAELEQEALALNDIAEENRSTFEGADSRYDQELLIQNTDAADTLILTIIRQKQDALDAILEARRARARAKRTREEAGIELKILRAGIDSSRSRQQEAVVNRAFLEDWISEGEGVAKSARDAELKASYASKRANQEVNAAFRSVAQTTLAHRRHHTTYIGLNYNFFRAYQSTAGLNPFRRHLGNGISNIESFGLSFYNRIGFFVSGYGRFTDAVPPEQFQGTLTRARLAQFERDELNDQVFVPHRLDSAMGNGTVFNAGLYISPVNHLYIMGGISTFSGRHWDIYYAEYPQHKIPEDIQAFGTNQYLTDYNEVNTSNLILGGAVVYPYWQFEAGYNFLQKSIFINGGINLPLRKTFAYRKTKKIDREEYDKLIRDYLKN